MKRGWWLIGLILLLAFATAGLIIGWRLSGVAEQELKSPVAEQVKEAVGRTPLGRLLDSPTPTPTLPPIPSAKTLPGGNQIFQTFNNCGPASLSMALSHFGLNVSQQTIGRTLRPYQQAQGNNDDKSVTFAELSALASEDYGFLVYHRPAGSVELLERLVTLDLPVLTRTLLTVNEDIGHYRVVKGYDQTAGVLIQDDSLQNANLRYAYDDFSALWQPFNYEFLVLVPVEKQTEVELVLGELLDEQVAWQKALELADTESARQPNNLYAGLNRSIALYHLGRYEESAMTYEQVAGRLPFRTLWYQLEPILAYYQLGEHDRVLSMTNEILNNANRAYSELYYLRGKIYEQRGDQSLANQAFADARAYNSSRFWQANLAEI